MKFGLLPGDPTRDRISLGGYLGKPIYPARRTWLSRVPSWPMYGNDEISDCIAPETRVLTADLRWVPVADLEVGDHLVGFDEEPPGNHGRFFRDAVVESADRVIRPCFELEFEDGTVVRSSAGHRWLTASTAQGELGCQRWVRTEDLRVGPTRTSRVIKPLDVWDVDRSWEAGYLAGAFDGEGDLVQGGGGRGPGNRIGFSQTENPMLPQVEACLKTLGYEYRHSIDSRSKRLRADGSERKDMHRLAVATTPQMLRFLGSVRPVRLLPKMRIDQLGRIKGRRVALVRAEYIGEREVVKLDTSARTYFAEGLASHNCVFAMAGHAIQEWTSWTGQLVTVSEPEIERAYSAVTGWVPGKPETDRGTVMQDALDHWRKVGIAGHRILAFAQVDHTNFDELKRAINIFGAVLVGIDFPQSAEAQFETRKPWDVVASDGGSLGGHAIHVGAYNPAGLGATTWGREQGMTNAFVRAYFREAWVAMSGEWLDSTGRNPVGLDKAGLAAQFSRLTAQPSPF